MRFIVLLALIFVFVCSAFAKVYNFDDEAYENFYRQQLQVSIPQGQIIYSRLNSNIESQSNKENEVITTQLMRDWVYYDKVIAPEGSLISGKITRIEKSSYANGNAKVYISFFKIIRPDNVEIDIQAKPICVTIGESRLKSGSKLIFEGVKKSVLSSPAVSVSTVTDSVVIGAFAGGYSFLTTKGEEVTIPFGTEFRINILNSINTTVYEN